MTKKWRWIVALVVACWAWAGVQAQPATEKRVALVIGNGAYPRAPLANPVNDAADLSAALRRLGFEVMERRNRNSEELKRDLIEFQDKLAPGAVGLFYFAGHGVQAGRGLNYLLPIGRDYLRERDAEMFGLEAGTVLRRMEESGAALSVVILDACRDSPLPPEARSSGSRGLARMEAPSGSLIAFATAAGSTADENRGGRNGLYTQFLLRAIETPGLRLEDVFQQVRRDVERASNRRQSPEEISKLTSTFFFRPATTIGTTANPMPIGSPPPGVTTGVTSLADLEREEQVRRQWIGWQERMQADFDRVSQFQGGADLRVQAWQRFLATWKDDNPTSDEDERLRQRAQQALAVAARETQARVAGSGQPIDSSRVPSGSPGTTVRPDSEVVVRIGHVAPLSGGISHLGQDNEKGARMAIDELNARGVSIGGARARFELVTEDDGADPRKAVAVAQRLVDAKVHGVIGHLTSGASIPASKIYSDAGIPQISPSATNPSFTRRGYRTTFRVIMEDTELGQALGRLMINQLRARSVLIVDDRTIYGSTIADEFEKGVVSAGGQVVGREYTSDKATDFSGIVSSLRNKRPDFVFFGGMDVVAGGLIRQMRQQGVSARLLGGDGICSGELPKLAGGSLPEGLVYCAEAGGVESANAKLMQDFYAAYRRKFSSDVQVYAPYTFDAVNVLVAAMIRSGSSDPSRYLPELGRTDNYRGITGPISFRSNGDLSGGAFTVYTYRGGRREQFGVFR